VLRRRIALRVLLVSIGISSMLGILAVLGGTFGHTAGKALATSVTVSCASLIALAAFAAWELPAARVLSRVGVWCSAIAMVLIVIGLWSEAQEPFWKLAAAVSVIAIGGAHGSMLQLARLAPKVQWPRTAALATGALLVATFLAMIWDDRSADSLAKLAAVLAIGDAGLTLAVVALHFGSRTIPPADGVDEVCFCPRCGKRLWVPAGEVRCRHCEEAFRIELHAKGNLPDAIAREVPSTDN
jgi:hypothetical protein